MRWSIIISCYLTRLGALIGHRLNAQLERVNADLWKLAWFCFDLCQSPLHHKSDRDVTTTATDSWCYMVNALWTHDLTWEQLVRGPWLGLETTASVLNVSYQSSFRSRSVRMYPYRINNRRSMYIVIRKRLARTCYVRTSRGPAKVASTLVVSDGCHYFSTIRSFSPSTWLN